MPDNREVALLAVRAAVSKKARDVKTIDLQGILPIADYFVICSTTSVPQMKAVVREISDVLGKNGVPGRSEGAAESGWVLLDYGDVIIHIFSEEARRFYDLERLWGFAPLIFEDEAVDTCSENAYN